MSHGSTHSGPTHSGPTLRPVPVQSAAGESVVRAKLTAMEERAVVAAQLGRPVRGAIVVVRQCSYGLPVVLRVPPVLDSGEPFPTRYWLSCPAARSAVSSLEAGGGVRAADEWIRSDPEFAQAMEAAHQHYAADRDRDIPTHVLHRPRGGVGGSRGGVKCLHAHLAHFLAGGHNPVGIDVARRVLPLACAAPCVPSVAGVEAREPARGHSRGEAP